MYGLLPWDMPRLTQAEMAALRDDVSAMTKAGG
jgi:hypothetical protein